MLCQKIGTLGVEKKAGMKISKEGQTMKSSILTNIDSNCLLLYEKILPVTKKSGVIKLH
jgi:hypothetical protein